MKSDNLLVVKRWNKISTISFDGIKNDNSTGVKRRKFMLYDLVRTLGSLHLGKLG